MRFAFVMTLLTVAGFASVSRPEEVAVLGEGSVTSDGYTYRKGFYWYEGVAYVRTAVQEPYTTYSSYYYCGRYYQTPYTSYKTVYKYTPVAITPQTPDWKTKLIDLAAARAAYDNDLVKSRVETENFAQYVKVLGLERNLFTYSGVIGSPFPGYAAATLSSAGVNGTTVYGHTYQQIDLQGMLDTSILQQGAVRTTETAQALAGQAQSNLIGLTDHSVAALMRVAETQAAGVARAQALEASKPPPTARIETSSSTPVPTARIETSTTTAVPQVEVQPINPFRQGEQLNRPLLRNQACAKCHSGESAQGGLDLSNWSAVTGEQKSKMMERMMSKDPAKRMPRDANDPSKPGPQLSPAQVNEIITK